MQSDKQFTFMSVFVIIFIILGHTYQPPFLFYPSQYFQFSLLFVLFGYNLEIGVQINDKIKYCLNISKRFFLIYFFFNSLFLLGSIILYKAGFNHNINVSIYDFFVEPFVSGHQFWLMGAAWFIPVIYLSTIALQLTVWKTTNYYIIFMIIIVLILNYFFLKIGLGNPTSVQLVLIKIVFCSLFLLLGFLHQKNEVQVNLLLRSKFLIPTLFIIIELIRINYGFNNDLSISISEGRVLNSNVLVPVITSILIVIIIMSTIEITKDIFKDNKIPNIISKYQTWIFFLHPSSFLVLNFILLILGKCYINDVLNIFYRYNINKYWFFYLIAGLCFPVFVGKTYHFVIYIVKLKCQKKNTPFC